jgi:hypothetical protein
MRGISRSASSISVGLYFLLSNRPFKSILFTFNFLKQTIAFFLKRFFLRRKTNIFTLQLIKISSDEGF